MTIILWIIAVVIPVIVLAAFLMGVSIGMRINIFDLLEKREKSVERKAVEKRNKRREKAQFVPRMTQDEFEKYHQKNNNSSEQINDEVK